MQDSQITRMVLSNTAEPNSRGHWRDWQSSHSRSLRKVPEATAPSGVYSQTPASWIGRGESVVKTVRKKQKHWTMSSSTTSVGEGGSYEGDSGLCEGRRKERKRRWAMWVLSCALISPPLSVVREKNLSDFGYQFAGFYLLLCLIQKVSCSEFSGNNTTRLM